MPFLQQLSVMAWMYDAGNASAFREYEVQEPQCSFAPVASGAWIPEGRDGLVSSQVMIR
jgi:hypothetical protein